MSDPYVDAKFVQIPLRWVDPGDAEVPSFDQQRKWVEEGEDPAVLSIEDNGSCGNGLWMQVDLCPTSKKSTVIRFEVEDSQVEMLAEVFKAIVAFRRVTREAAERATR
jgi:hypothetical protein